MQNKTKKAIGGAAGAAAATAAILIAAVNGGAVEIPYTLEENAYVSIMEVTPPEDAEADVVELLLNGETVDKALLPGQKLAAPPLVFSDLENLELKIYCRGKTAGTAYFKDGKLYYTEKGGLKNEK